MKGVALADAVGAAPAAPSSPVTLGEFFSQPCRHCGGEMESAMLSLYVGGRGYVAFWRCGRCEAFAEVDWSQIISQAQKTAGIRESRARYVAESCHSYRPAPSAEAIEAIRRAVPGAITVSVFWYAPPLLEAIVTTLCGEPRYIAAQVYRVG